MKTKTYQHFEAKPCGRCGGSGHFAFNLKDGTICYGCSGRGLRHTKRGAEGYGRYIEAFRACKEVTGRDITPGTVLAVRDRDGVSRWHTVVSADLIYTDELVGSSTNVGIDGAPRYEAVLVEFADGEQDALSAMEIHRGHAATEDIERVLGCRIEDLPGYIEDPVEGWNS